MYMYMYNVATVCCIFMVACSEINPCHVCLRHVHTHLCIRVHDLHVRVQVHTENYVPHVQTL